MQKANADLLDWLVRNNQNHQPGNFWSREIYKEVGKMNEDLHYAFDWDYWLRFISAGYYPNVFNDHILANFRLHDDSKTVKHWARFNTEYVGLIHKYKGLLNPSALKKANREAKKLILNEKIKFGSIESINGKYHEAFKYFKSAIETSPALLLSPDFIFEFLKAMAYMPIRRKIGKA
jgi:hypothetical protein